MKRALNKLKALISPVESLAARQWALEDQVLEFFRTPIAHSDDAPPQVIDRSTLQSCLTKFFQNFNDNRTPGWEKRLHQMELTQHQLLENVHKLTTDVLSEAHPSASQMSGFVGFHKEKGWLDTIFSSVRNMENILEQWTQEQFLLQLRFSTDESLRLNILAQANLDAMDKGLLLILCKNEIEMRVIFERKIIDASILSSFFQRNTENSIQWLQNLTHFKALVNITFECSTNSAIKRNAKDLFQLVQSSEHLKVLLKHPDGKAGLSDSKDLILALSPKLTPIKNLNEILNLARTLPGFWPSYPFQKWIISALKRAPILTCTEDPEFLESQKRNQVSQSHPNNDPSQLNFIEKEQLSRSNFHDFWEKILLLIENIDEPDERNWTALHWFSIQMNPGAIEILIHAGANPLLQSHAGQRPSGLLRSLQEIELQTESRLENFNLNHVQAQQVLDRLELAELGHLPKAKNAPHSRAYL